MKRTVLRPKWRARPWRSGEIWFGAGRRAEENPGVGKRQAVLGIDLGTSQVKALVMTPDEEILGRGRAGYRVVSPLSLIHI